MVLAAALAIAACGEVPRPFQPDAMSRDPLAAPDETLLIRVDAVDGPPLPLARLLARAVAEELAARDVTAAARAAANSRYVLKGEARLNPDHPGDPHVAVIEWRLIDGDGEIVALHTEGVEGSALQWEYGDPGLIRAAGRGTAQAIAALLADEREARALVEPRGLFVLPVQGAPGDGNEALARAVRIALKATSITLADTPERAAYGIEGIVAAAAPADGRQAVRIVWTVTAADGRRLARLTQENSVPAGSLDGAWGPMAALIAAAVAEDIGRAIAGGA